MKNQNPNKNEVIYFKDLSFNNFSNEITIFLFGSWDAILVSERLSVMKHSR